MNTRNYKKEGEYTSTEDHSEVIFTEAQKIQWIWTDLIINFIVKCILSIFHFLLLL